MPLTPDQLRASLAQYDIVAFEDLAHLHTQNRLMFEFFQRHHRPVFAPRQRLVLYTSHELLQDFLNHIQRAAAKIDISNCFILIVNPRDISQQLRAANQQYGYNDVCINHVMVDLEATESLGTAGFIKNYKTICPAPFAHINADLTNNYTAPCCKISTGSGSPRNQDLMSIFNNQVYQELRNAMRLGETLPECKTCWQVEKHGGTSLRKHLLNYHDQDFDFELYDNATLRNLQFIPSTLCNFTCRICSAKASTSIAAEDFKYANNELKPHYKKLLIQKDIDIPRLVAAMQHCKTLHLLGGETLLWPQLGNFLTQLHESKTAANLSIILNTNGSVCPDVIKPFVGAFKRIEISISLDDIEARFEIQRGGSWSSVHQNIVSFVEISSQLLTVQATPTINIQNVLYLDELYQYCASIKLPITWTYLESPSVLCIDNVTQSVKQIVNAQYANHQDSELRALNLRMQANPAVCGKQFLDFVHKFDRRRSQNFQSCHQKIYQAMSEQ